VPPSRNCSAARPLWRTRSSAPSCTACGPTSARLAGSSTTS